jgi:hypothetical protein
MREYLALILPIAILIGIFALCYFLLRSAQNDPKHKRGDDAAYPPGGGA